MRRSLLAVAAIAATATALVALPAHAATAKLSFRGMTLTLPSGWKVSGKGDWLKVVTGTCAKPKAGYNGQECQAFWVFGPKAIKEGQELFNPYTGKRPYYPATDVQPCPIKRKLAQSFDKPKAEGLRQVGPGHKAAYRAWNFSCRPYEHLETVKLHYVQREWFLPKSRILVVDQFGTPGLDAVLKNASWQ
ncbi:hypothetical protein ACIBHX_39135 [Nonomuraea sp. NPDC050536]|uniref:hypothetical protein n=1 Tax=Nonomuraea sp. NPDC050536 TaxID=3364366 RepID=UPI0037C91371